jgi:hypothetical protein
MDEVQRTTTLQQLLDTPKWLQFFVNGTRQWRSGAGPGGGALTRPSISTSTFTPWALVTLLPCHAWHGRGVHEVPGVAISVINTCREPMHGEFFHREKHDTRTQALGSPARPFRDVFSRPYYTPRMPSYLEECDTFAGACEGEKGTVGSTLGRGCWSTRQIAVK